MSVRELLLEFAGESLLHLVEIREERHWDEDHDCALAMADFELQILLDFCPQFGYAVVVPHGRTGSAAVEEKP